MKVFEPNIPEEKYKFEYPDSMRVILNYLDQNGKLNVDPHIVEKLWYAFSEIYCAGFLIPDEELLKQFVNYIHKIDIEDAMNMDYYGTVHEEGFYDKFYDELFDEMND